MATIGFLDRLDSIEPQLFYAYWQDVHGVLGARISDIHQYWQHYLAAPDSTLLPAVLEEAGISTVVAETRQIEGFAELTFVSEEMRGALASSPAAGQLALDEQNVFKGTYLHSSVANNTQAVFDAGTEETTQGERSNYRVILLVAEKEGDSAQKRLR